MIRNYFRVAIRNLFKNRTYSFINVFGLALGLATGFIMLTWVNNEYSMNRYHTHADHIYQVNAKLDFGGTETVWENTPAPLAPFAKDNLGDIEKVVRIKSDHSSKQVVKYKNDVFVETNIGYTENEFFQIFDFPIVAGNSKEPLAPGLSVALTESVARKYFGSDNPIGKIIRFRDTTFQVSSVMKDFPANSSIQFSMLFSMDLVRMKFKGNGDWKTIDQDWGNYNYSTFCLVRPNAELAKDGRLMAEALRKQNPNGAVKEFIFRPLKNIYLYQADGTPGRIIMVKIFLIVAIFVLLIACINYVNLVTARATQRVKEISIRKIIGAEKQQLFWQFFIETGVLLLLASLASIAFIEIMLPVYKQVSGNTLTYSFGDPQLWKVAATIILSVWLLTGLYPALLLSAFRPMDTLKGGSFLSNAGLLRKSLVVLQFVVSITLLLGTVFIHRQMNYVQDKDLNISTSNVLVFPVWKLKEEAAESFKGQLRQYSGFSDVTASSISLFEGANTTTDLEWTGKGKDEEFWIAQFYVDKNFMDFFHTSVISGKNFATTSPGVNDFILSETAVKRMRLKDPIGQTIKFHNQPGTVIGVMKDFYFQSFHEELMPAIMKYQPQDAAFLYARVQQGDAGNAIAYAQKLWKGFEPVLPMEYGFLDDKVAAQYDKETRAAHLFDAFTIITLFISCLGLFGLATHTAERRVKEIGIRKVLGAEISSIVSLLSKEFVWLVLIAIVISVPIVWYGMNKLLNYFAYRISLQWWVFATTAIAAVLIAVITVGLQGMKAATANPVKSLRNE